MKHQHREVMVISQTLWDVGELYERRLTILQQVKVAEAIAAEPTLTAATLKRAFIDAGAPAPWPTSKFARGLLAALQRERGLTGPERDKRGRSVRIKRLYRVTAVYGDRTTTRNYQTKTAAEHHAAVLRAEWEPPKVTVIASDPITWPVS